MDAYGDYLSGWYDKFLEEQNQLLVKLAKGSYADLLSGIITNERVSAAEVFKGAPLKVDTAAALPSQGAVVEELMKGYPGSGAVAAAMAGNDAGRYVKEMSGSIMAALNLDVMKFNREFAGLATNNPAIKGIVERAVELSTMQRPADTETAPEDGDVPNAVEEFVETNPEAARTITEEFLHIILETTGKPRDWWDGLSVQDRCWLVYEFSQLAFRISLMSATMPGGMTTGVYLTGELVICMVAMVIISWDAKEQEDEK